MDRIEEEYWSVTIYSVIILTKEWP